MQMCRDVDVQWGGRGGGGGGGGESDWLLGGHATPHMPPFSLMDR